MNLFVKAIWFGAVLNCALDASHAADPLLLKQADQALRESIPQVAILKLNAFLGDAADNSPEERAAASRKLGEALLAAGQPVEALAAIESLVAAGDDAAKMLRADILVSAQRWDEALPLYRLLAARADSIGAQIGEAECLKALGRIGPAVAVLEAAVRKKPGHILAQLRLASFYIDAVEVKKARKTLAEIRPTKGAAMKWKGYLEGRLFLLEGQPEPARVSFKEVLQDPRELSEEMLVGATLGVTDARIITEGYDAADRELETFIWQNPNSSHLQLMFARLDEIYSHQDDPREGELQKWIQVAPTGRAALARYYVARMQIRSGKLDKASNTLAVFIQTYPAHKLLPKVHQLRADLLLQKNDFAGAVRAMEAAERHVTDNELRAEIELRTGLAQYQAGEYLLAGTLFENAARRSVKLRESALYNGALAALNQRNYERFLALYREFTSNHRDSPLRSELFLEQGLLQARSEDFRAPESLQSFLRQFPKHARVNEARLALAELALKQGEVEAAEGYRQASNEAQPSTEVSDHSQYLAIFLLDAQTPRRDDAIIELATAFIRERPQSPLLGEVRMKLGQIYFGHDDFANAETQFATLVRENPTSPYAESALFLAGQSAMKTINTGSVDRALDLFDQVVKRDGPLKLYAREQQAVMQRRLDKETEAVKLYDIILASQPPPDAELGFAALAGKGDNLLSLGRKDPKQLELAIEVFGQLATSASVPAVWRNQALYKKAKALELLARVPEALTTYYDVLTPTTADGREFVWFYKAGFEAARILEGQEQWKAAIGIYEKIGKLDGPRAAEAKAQMKKLRLEHLIWD